MPPRDKLIADLPRPADSRDEVRDALTKKSRIELRGLGHGLDRAERYGER